MEHIVISKINSFNSKANLYKNINGKVIEELVDVKSTKDIINYAKNNFYTLENLVIDDNCLSFNYGKYKVTFKDFNSYDFIIEKLNKLKDNNLEKTLIFNQNDLVIKIKNFEFKLKNYNQYNDILYIFNKIKDLKSDIIPNIKSNDLSFYLDNIKIILKDYKKFESNNTLRFVLKKAKEKKLKLVKKRILIGTLALVGAISIGSLINGNETNSALAVNTQLELEEDENINEIVEENIETASNIQTTSNETTSNIQTTVNNENTTSNETNYYTNLNIGANCCDEKFLETQNLYSDLIEYYASKYNLDSNVILAIATQERGIHSSNVDDGGAIGLMQIQVDVWNNEVLVAYDYENDCNKTFNITLDKLRDLEYNIEVGCAIFQNYLKEMNGNYIAAIQSYNNGYFAVNNMIDEYAKSCGKTRNEVLESNDLSWLSYRSDSYAGDSSYLEHVLRYCNSSSNDRIY